VWWYTPVTTALGRWWQEDCEFGKEGEKAEKKILDKIKYLVLIKHFQK
jgi:hypothetical protein